MSELKDEAVTTAGLDDFFASLDFTKETDLERAITVLDDICLAMGAQGKRLENANLPARVDEAFAGARDKIGEVIKEIDYYLYDLEEAKQ